MTKKQKLFIKLSIVAAALIVAAISYLRPEKELSEQLLQKEYQGKDAIAEIGDISKSRPIENVKFPNDPVKKDAEAETPADKLKKANESIADSYQKHGANAVLKSGDKLDEREKYHGKYTLNEPDFANLHPINYKGLKKVYTYFRLKESLPEIVVNQLNGAAVVMTGAVMPIDKIPEDGVFSAFWLSNPSIVLAGCVFCNPPTLADIIYVYKDRGENPFKFEREKLFKQVVLVRVTGRLFFGPETIKDQIFLFSILATDIEILN
ncbi:MAG TPA: hypothetical protein PKG52_06810 [bacterium]|nr:hypothetical protein [bacterium]HPS30629.1 hypothetical protein [bacterium]